MPTILLNNIRPKGSLLKNLKVGSTEVKYVKRGDGKFFYDTQNDTTYSAITISKFSYSTATVAASGGSTSTPSYSYSQTATPVGHAGSYSSSTITSGASVSFSKVSGDGATVNSTTGVVTFDSRGTTYSASQRSAVVRITVSLNGKSATKDCTVYQNKNVITSMIYSASSGGALTNPATYAAGGATKSVANKTSASATVQLTFSSTSKTTSYGSYGTLTTTYSWSSNQQYATLSSSNASSKDVTMASRGTDYSNSNRTATITRSVAFSYSLSSDYNNANLSAITASKSATATVTQEANPFTTIIITVSGGSLTNPANYVAKGGTKNVANATAASVNSVKLTFKSGSSVTDYSKYGSLSGPTYSWKSSQSYATLTSANSASLDVTMANRTTTYGASTRSATITRTATFTYTLNSDYAVTTNNPGTATATATVTQNKNVFKSAVVSVNAGALTNPDTYVAGGGTKTVSNSTAASLASVTLTFDSESTTTSYSTYGSVSGPVYSWSSNQSYATLSSSNASSLDVTMASRGTTYANSERKATITRKATYTFSLSSSYTGISATTGYANTTATVTQAKNIITSFGKPSISAGALTNPSTYTAAAQTQQVANKTAASASVTLTFSSGSTKVTSDSTYGSFTGPTYSWSSNQSYATLTSSNAASLNVTMTSRGTTYSTSTRSATITRTASFSYALSSSYNAASLSSSSNSASTTATVTQAKNVITKTEFTSPSGGALTNPATYAAGGATKSVANKTAASTGVKLTFSSTSTSTSYDSYGTLTGPTYSWSSNQSYATLNSANSSSLDVTMANRTTNYGGSRTATITRTAAFSYSLDSDYNNASLAAITTSKTATATVTQSSNNFTAVNIKIGAGTLTNPATYAASGGTKSVASASAASLTSITLTFASGSTTTDYNAYGSASGPVYSWTSSQPYATLTSANSASLNVTMADRATTHGAQRTAKITRKATYTYTFSSTYGGSSTPNSANATATVTQAANTLSVKSVTVSGGALTAPSTYGAGGATQSVANKTAATATGVLLFASGDEVAASSTYGSWSGPTYSWTSSQTYATLSSSNAASKDVTMSNRTTTIGNSRTADITRTASFTFTLSSTYGSGSKSNTGSCKATITQAANLVTVVTSNINSFSYGSKAVAKGGTVNATSDRSCTLTFTSGSTKSGCTTTAGYTGGTITNTASWAGSATGATVATSTGNVTWANRTTTIGKERSVEVTMSAKYTFTHSSTYGGAAIEGNTATKKATCYQNANLVTAVTANSNTFSYANIGAGTTSATPSTSHAPKYTFSSTSTSTTTPNNTYGSLTTTCSYAIANTTTNGFTACNSSTGVLTATARGTTIGNARASATVTKTLKYTWTPASGYGSAVNSGNLTKTATCTQNGNYVTAVTCTANTLSYAAIGAGATSSGTPTYNFGNAKFTYSSGSSAEGAPSTTYGTYSSSVKFTIANTTTNGFTGINATTGVLTSTSRGTTIGNARPSATVTCTLTMTWTPTSSYNAGGTKSGTKTATATCTQNGNYVTAISNQIDTFSYGSAVAKGGSVSPNVSRSCTLTFSSGSTKAGCTTSAGYTGGTITNTVSYSGSATGATVNTSSGTVTWANRTTTIGNSRSVTVTATSSYTFTHDSSYNSGKAITGTAKTQKATCSQNANYVTAVSVNSNSLSYSNIGAGATSASPTSSHTPIFTFSSTSTSTTTPGSSYGTLTTTVKYTLATSKNGFTSVNANSGVLTATARGTTIGNARTSDTVTKSLTYSWAHSSTYSGGGTKASSASTKTATCTQAGNYVTAVTSVCDFSYGSNATASGGTISVSNASSSCTLTFTSGSTKSGCTASAGYTGGTIATKLYNYSGSATGATLNTSNGSVTWANRGTSIGNARSINVTMNYQYTFTHSSTYGSGVIDGSIAKVSKTCTQAGNYVTKVTPAAESGYTTNVTYPNISAAGGTSTPALHGTTTYTYSSGSTGGKPDATYGSASVTRAYSGTLATGFTAINATTGVVTASDRGTTEGAARSQTVTVKMTVTWTPTSSYNAAGTITGSVTHTPTCTQNANSKTLTSIKIVATQPDASWLATSSWSSVPASGHYLGVYGYYCYTWSSGDPSETLAGNLKTGLTYTTSMAEVHTNGGLHILNRTTTIGKARSGTVYWTYNGLTSNTLSFTQVANLVTAVAVNSNSFSYANAGAGATSKAATTSHAPIFTFTSGKTSTTTPSSTYGSLSPTVTYSLASSKNGFTAVNSSTGALTCTSRGTTIGNARASDTVTKSVTYKWTPTSGYGSAVTSAASKKTATCTQVGNYVTEITSVSASNTSYGHTYYANTAAAGATTSPTTNGTATYKFTSGSTGTYSSSSVPSGVTWTWTRTYSVSGTATSGSSLNTSNGAVTWTNNTSTSTRSTKVSIKLTVSVAHSSTYSAGGTVSKSSTITATSTQNAGSQTKHINAASLSFTAAGGTKTPTVTYTIKWNGIATSTTNSLTSFSLTETADAGGKFRASGTSVTASANTSTSSTYSATYTISASGYNNGTLTCSMSKDAVSSYNNPVISSFTVSDVPAKGGTISSGSVSYSQVVNYVSGNKVTLTTGGTVTYSTGITGSNLTTTLKARTKLGTLTATVTMNGKKGTKTADVYQAINQVTSIAFTPDSSASTQHCYWSTTSFGAGGGSCAVTLNGNVVATYSSGSTGKPSTGGSFSYSRTYSASGTGFTVDTAGKVTAANRTSNIGNKRTGTVSSALTITWTPTSIGSKKTCTANASASLSQNGNYVTGLTCQSNTMSYANVGAGATASAAPTTSWGNALFTYSSGTQAAGAPASTYGTYSSSKSFTIANKTTNGFTNINASTGVLTCTARGTTIGNARASATVTCKLTMTWTPTSSYNAVGTITGSKQATATCTQNGNYVTKIVASASSGYSTHVTYPNITAAGGTSTPTLSGSATFTFSSGSTGSAPSTTYGTTTYTRTYSYSSLATGFTAVNSNTGVVTASNRETTFGNARSQTVTSKLTVKFVHASSYSNGGTVSSAALSHSPTCTQNGNYVTAVTPKASTGYSTHASYASTISAAGGTVSPTNHGMATYTFSSGKTVTDGSTSWTTAGTTTYTRTYSATLATGFTSVTTAGAVTASGRGKTSGNARSQTVSAKLTVKFVHSSTYSAGGTKEGSVTHSITCTQNHNNPSTVYNTPTIASATSSDIPASGGTFAKSWLTVKYNQTAYYNYPSGSNTSSSPHSVASSATATQAMISFTGTAPKGSNLGTTAYSRTSKGSVTVTVTANSKTSSGKSVTVYQQANQGTTVTTEIKPTLSYAGMSSQTGQTSTPTVGYTWKYYTSYTSGKDTDVYTVNSPNGPGISAMSPNYTLNNTTYFSINASTGVVTTKSANTSTTADRTATVTLKLTFGGKTGQTTATVTQSKKASSYSQAWKFSVFNVTNSIYSFGFKFTNSAGNQLTLTGGGGSGGTQNPSREGTSSIRSDVSTSVFRPNGFYLTNMSSAYSSANNSSGYYQDGSTGKYYYVRWAYNKAPTTSNYKTHGYKFYSGIVESWTYSAGTLYVWVYQS